MPKSGSTFVEPFAGRGNVFFAAAHFGLNFRRWHINDLETAKFFRTMLTHGGSIRVPERTKTRYDIAKVRFQHNDPRAILLEPYWTFSGGGYKSGCFGNTHNGVSRKGYQEILRRGQELLKLTKAQITAVDWKETLTGLGSDAFVFLDPPYFGCDVRAYSNSLDFHNLIQILSNAKFKWMLTEYRQPMYTEAFGTPRAEFEVKLGCSRQLNGAPRHECVWTNY